MDPYVVGLDGSSPARGALRWAFGAAVRHDTRLEVVTVLELPRLARMSWEGCVLPSLADVLQLGELKQEQIVHEELGDDAHDSRISRYVTVGDAASALTARARFAALLVVGRRTRFLPRLLRASVGARCVDHAPCPVVVVREPRRLTARREQRALRGFEREGSQGGASQSKSGASPR